MGDEALEEVALKERCLSSGDRAGSATRYLMEKDTIVEAYRQHRVCAVILERIIDAPHNRIHRVLKEMVMVVDEPRKHARKK